MRLRLGLLLLLAAAPQRALGNNPPPPSVSPPPHILGTFRQIGFDMDGEAPDDYSGFAVATNGDGTMIVVGAYGNDGAGYDAGHVRIYQRADTASEVWTQLGADIDGEAEGDYSGFSVAMSTYGRTVAVGAYRNRGADAAYHDAGHVRVYDWRSSSGEWVQRGGDLDGDAVGERLAWSVGLSGDGLTVVAGYISGHSVSVNHANSANADDEVDESELGCGVQRWTWSSAASDWIGAPPIATGSGTDATGFAVAVNGDGTTVAIGAPGAYSNAGSVKVWQAATPDTLANVYTSATGGDLAGFSVALDDAGTTLVFGAPGCDSSKGKAYTVTTDDAWTSVTTINEVASNDAFHAAGDEFGIAVATNFDGQRVAVGAHRSAGSKSQAAHHGHTRLFHWSGSSWSQYTVDVHPSQGQAGIPYFTTTWNPFLGSQRRSLAALAALPAPQAPEVQRRQLSSSPTYYTHYRSAADIAADMSGPALKAKSDDPSGAHTYKALWLEPELGTMNASALLDEHKRVWTAYFGDGSGLDKYEHVYFGNGSGHCLPEVGDLFTFVDYEAIARETAAKEASSAYRPLGGFFRSLYEPTEAPPINYSRVPAAPAPPPLLPQSEDGREAPPSPPATGQSSGRRSLQEPVGWTESDLLALHPEELRRLSGTSLFPGAPGLGASGGPHDGMFGRETKSELLPGNNEETGGWQNWRKHNFASELHLSEDGTYMCVGFPGWNNPDQTWYLPDYYGPNQDLYGCARVYEYKGATANPNLHNNGPFAAGWEQVGEDVTLPDLYQMWREWMGTDTFTGSHWAVPNSEAYAANGDQNVNLNRFQMLNNNNGGLWTTCHGISYNTNKAADAQLTIAIGSEYAIHPRDLKAWSQPNDGSGWDVPTYSYWARGVVQARRWDPDANSGNGQWLPKGQMLWGAHPHSQIPYNYGQDAGMSADGDTIYAGGQGMHNCDHSSDWVCTPIPDSEAGPGADGKFHYGSSTPRTTCSRTGNTGAAFNPADRPGDLHVWTYEEGPTSASGSWRLHRIKAGDASTSGSGIGKTHIRAKDDRCNSNWFIPLGVCDDGTCIAIKAKGEGDYSHNTGSTCGTETNDAWNYQNWGRVTSVQVLRRASINVDTWTPDRVAARPAAFTWNGQSPPSSNYPIKSDDDTREFISTIDSKLGAFCQHNCDAIGEGDICEVARITSDRWRGVTADHCGAGPRRMGETEAWTFPISGDGKTLVVTDSYAAPSTLPNVNYGGTTFDPTADSGGGACVTDLTMVSGMRPIQTNGGFEMWEATEIGTSGRYMWTLKQVAIADVDHDASALDANNLPAGWHEGSANVHGILHANHIRLWGMGMRMGRPWRRSAVLSTDGSRMIIGAKDDPHLEWCCGGWGPQAQGAAFVFVKDATSGLFVAREKLVQTGARLDNDAQYGSAVAMSGDGETVAITAPNYELENFEPWHEWLGETRAGRAGLIEVWSSRVPAEPPPPAPPLPPPPAPPPELFNGVLDGSEPGDRSGRSLALSGDGKTVVVGAPLHDGDGAAGGASDNRGHVRAFTVAPDLPGNTLVSELTTAMVGSATAYADSTSASCGEGTHMQSGQCVIDCDYTAPPPAPSGRRLSDGADGADGAADSASRGWRDRDPLEDAVAAVGHLLATEPDQAAPLFLHLEPMLEAALSEDA
ncbi:MAG: hypothetical protein CMM61_03755 [Rhodospirillaceae bacterium]|nr:hypothetical protein [Rhodospirillaceae bacterium]